MWIIYIMDTFSPSNTAPNTRQNWELSQIPKFKRRSLSLKRNKELKNGVKKDSHSLIVKEKHLSIEAINLNNNKHSLISEKVVEEVQNNYEKKIINHLNSNVTHHTPEITPNERGLQICVNNKEIYQIPEVTLDTSALEYNVNSNKEHHTPEDTLNSSAREISLNSNKIHHTPEFSQDVSASGIDINGTIIQHSPKVTPNSNTHLNDAQSNDCFILDNKQSFISLSSTTELGCNINESLDTIIYDKPTINVSFALNDCKDVNVTTKNSSIRKVLVSHGLNDTNIDCEIIGNSQESDIDISPSPSEMQVVSVNLEIKKKNLSTSEDQSKVLILNTNAIEKLSHVIVQPPNYKRLRRKIQGKCKISSSNKSKSVISSSKKNGKVSVDGVKLNQIRIDTLFKKIQRFDGIRSVSKEKKNSKLHNDVENCEDEVLGHDDMSKTVRADTARSDGVGRLSRRVSKEENVLSRSSRMPYRDTMSQIRTSNSEAPQLPSPRCKNESASSCSPRRNIDSLHFNLPSKTRSNKTSVTQRDIPHYKIVAGTHFAVDAFCYGDIPGVKNYFLTHFHSDHYSGLKKSFNKVLFCTQITADLCTSRLGVNIKHIHVINLDETVRVDGVEVTALDANHCPGAVMLLFTLPNGKTLLHTGDFRATPAMESHPAFWNSDIHTIYLDTTYCNPRYDFPTQDQSLEMALHILRQKKTALEKDGKKFASVLIVCGTYTIGKEKFFLGLARRVGCAVWACPEKDKVLQTVEKRSFSHASPQSCQLHVVPMRDLTHEKLRSYLDSLQGPFSEVVAFKPSGWENGKTTPATKNMVTVHGIPYSEHSSFSEMIRFVNFLKPKQVVPTVDISGGVKAVQKYFPCPLVYKEDVQCQSKLTDFFNVQNRQQISAVS